MPKHPELVALVVILATCLIYIVGLALSGKTSP